MNPPQEETPAAQVHAQPEELRVFELVRKVDPTSHVPVAVTGHSLAQANGSERHHDDGHHGNYDANIHQDLPNLVDVEAARSQGSNAGPPSAGDGSGISPGSPHVGFVSSGGRSADVRTQRFKRVLPVAAKNRRLVDPTRRPLVQSEGVPRPSVGSDRPERVWSSSRSLDL